MNKIIKETIGQLKSGKRLRLILGIGFLVIIGWGGNMMFNIRSVERRLEAQANVRGGEAQVKGIAWYSQLFMLKPVLEVTLEMENTGSIDLEVAEVVVILHDPFFREQRHILKRRTNTNPPPQLLRAGETRMVEAGGFFATPPLSWTKMDIQVKVEPATENTLGRIVRWTHTQVTFAGYEEGLYRIAGWSRDARFVTNSGVGVRPEVITSFYNEKGDFIGGAAITLNGVNQFETTYERQRFPKGTIASYRIHFIEAFTHRPIIE